MKVLHFVTFLILAPVIIPVMFFNPINLSADSSGGTDDIQGDWGNFKS